MKKTDAIIKVAGLVKNSFVDWPGYIASVVFLGGCNIRCYYCHNHNILCATSNSIPWVEVLEQIKERVGFIDGVVISGGEPALHPNLLDIIQDIKSLNLLVKLDTNGTNSSLLQDVIEKKLVDFIAMDIKAPFTKLKAIIGTDKFNDEIKKSIEILKSQKNIPFMFRVTPCPELTFEDFEEINALAGGFGFKKNYFTEVNNADIIPEV